MKTAIDDLTTFECARHFIDPQGIGDFLRSDDTWHDGMNNISGHDESNSTQCPGVNLKSYLPALRSVVASRLGWSATTTLGKNISARELVVGDSVTFTGSNAVRHSLEGWYKAPGAEPITYLSGYALAQQYADLGAQAQVWSPDTAWPPGGAVTFLQPGHYTMHVRPESGGYEANLTFLVKRASTTSSIHVGDLDGAAVSLGARWTAQVTVTIHDATEGAVAGAKVSGKWSGGYSGPGSCETAADGLCSLTTGSLTKPSVTFAVTGVVSGSAVYDATANHDPDGAGDGTSITLYKP